MPFGTIAWLVEHANVSKTTIVAASHGNTIQADVIERLMKATGLSRSCFGECSKNNAASGKRVEADKISSSDFSYKPILIWSDDDGAEPQWLRIAEPPTR
jgi:hypothetical protein